MKNEKITCSEEWYSVDKKKSYVSGKPHSCNIVSLYIWRSNVPMGGGQDCVPKQMVIAGNAVWVIAEA